MVNGARSGIEGIKILLGIGFGGLLSIATIVLIHNKEWFWGLLCFAGIFFIWIHDNEKSTPAISIVFLVGGLIELFSFQNELFGGALIVLSLLAYLVPKMV